MKYHFNPDSLLLYFSICSYWLTLCLLVLMSIIHACVCLRRGLWLFPCYPSRFSTALNVVTLGLLGFIITGPDSSDDTDRDYSDYSDSATDLSECYHWQACVAVCGVMGACLPSIAVVDRRQMWGQVAGAALLLINLLSRSLFYVLYPSGVIHSHLQRPISVGLATCLLVFLLLLVLQALVLDEMLCDLEACVTRRLRQRKQENAAPMFYVHTQAQNQGTIMRWSWESLQREACVKLMMALTSNPQNVASRMPSSAIASITLIAIITLVTRMLPPMPVFRIPFQVLGCLNALMCLSRYVSVAICETRPLTALLLDRHPCNYARHKLTNLLDRLRAPPPYRLLEQLSRRPTCAICQLLTFSLKFVLYHVLRSIIPIFCMLLVAIMFVHLLLTFPLHLLIESSSRLLIRKPSPDLSRSSSREAKESSTSFMPVDVDLVPGVVCIPGEDVRMVHELFERPAKRAIRRQSKKANKLPFQELKALLRLSKHSCHLKKEAVLEVLEQQGAYERSDPGQFPLQYGEQYGWSLTILSLLAVMNRVEVTCCENIQLSLSAIEAYKQAVDMIDIVEEMQAPRTVCSKETYLSASKTLWRSLLHKGHKGRLGPKKFKDDKGKNGATNILDQQLEFARMQLEKYVPMFPWTMETMKAYTMYTVCNNLQRWFRTVSNEETLEKTKDTKELVEHIYYLIAEVLTGCLHALPIVLDAYIEKAIRACHETRIKVSMLAICQAQQIWESLDWPQHMDVDTSIQFSIVADGFPLNEFWLQHDVCASRKHAHTYKHSRSWS